MQLANEVSFQIYVGKIGEIEFQKNQFEIFQDFFSGKFQKMIGIRLQLPKS